MNSQNKKQIKLLLFTLVAVLTLGIGYASINAINLIISGNATASVNDNNFKVYFVNTADTPSLTGNVTVSGNARINTGDNTKAEFDVSGLTKEGDYAIATYTILNNSNSIGADISLYITNSNPEYFRVTETITDSKLQAGDTTTGSIKVELIKTPLNNDVSTSVTGTLKADAIENDTATGLVPKSKASDDPESFATDSWATIKKAVQDNNTSVYNVGDTKTVTINNTDYIVRIANKTTGEHCGDNDTAYSQTACGFVVEFVDIITQMRMNMSYQNDGGYPASEVYTYLQSTLYNSLPSDIKSVIKPTRVISGYGNNGTDLANFTTTDNLYLLSGVEVFGSDSNDTASNTTSQLDYYKKADAITYKYYNGSISSWWTRTATSFEEEAFTYIDGSLSYTKSVEYYGVSPAFRIG